MRYDDDFAYTYGNWRGELKETGDLITQLQERQKLLESYAGKFVIHRWLELRRASAVKAEDTARVTAIAELQAELLAEVKGILAGSPI